MEIKRRTAEDLQVPTDYKLTKSHAQRLLRKYFLGAQMKVRTTPEDEAAGNARWQVWCKGSYGKEQAIVEVLGPPAAMTKACLGAALRRVGLAVEYVHVPSKVGPGTWGVRISLLKNPQDVKAEEAAPITAPEPVPA